MSAARFAVVLPALAVAAGAVVATAHGLFAVAVAALVPEGIAWLYPLITDGLALVAYAATHQLGGRERGYAWSVVVLAAVLSGLAQAAFLGGGSTVQVSPPLAFGVGAWPAIAAAIVAHLVYLLITPTIEPQSSTHLDTQDVGPDPAGLPATSATLADRRSAGSRGPVWLYRLYDRQGDLLYIGQSSDVDRRLAEHAANQPWWAEVDLDRTTRVECATRAEALLAERDAIRSDRPRCNIHVLHGWTDSQEYQEQRARAKGLPAPAPARRRREVAADPAVLDELDAIIWNPEADEESRLAAIDAKGLGRGTVAKVFQLDEGPARRKWEAFKNSREQVRA